MHFNSTIWCLLIWFSLVTYAEDCISGEDCVISCDSSTNCTNSIIDGIIASFLTVRCESDSLCTGTIINCPIGGCNITCHWCYDVEINYAGTETIQSLDLNGNINIVCNSSYACQNLGEFYMP